jgi:hypothetical protein
MIKPPIDYAPFQIGSEIGYKISTRCPQANSSLNWEEYLFILGRVVHTAELGIWRGITHKKELTEFCASFEEAVEFVTLEGIHEWLEDRKMIQLTTNGSPQTRELIHQRTWLEIFAQATVAAQKIQDDL